MYKTILALSMALVVVAVSAGKTEGKKGGAHPMMNMTCKGDNVNSKVFWVGQQECAKEVLGLGTGTTTAKPADSAEAKKEFFKKYIENAMCIDVCKWKKQGYLNADGSYNKEGAEKLVKAAFPAKVQADMKKAFDECAAANSKSLSTDNKCASYKAFKECKTKKYMEICEVKLPKKSSE